MVQIAINEDIIRYEKTQLIWTANYPTVLAQDTINERVKQLKDTVVNMLKSRSNGIPLAQIPLILKRKLKFQLKISELGYKKLKDLLKTIPEVTLKSDSCKNPCAFYSIIPATIFEIQTIVNEVIGQNQFSVMESKLSKELGKRLGKIDWEVYETSGLISFIELYCKNISVMPVGNEYICIGRESESEDITISNHNSEYFLVTDTTDEKCDYHLLDMNSFDN